MEASLIHRMEATAFAFRGYNVTNLGRTPELLAHPLYGPVVRWHLEEASRICADTIGEHVDLVERVETRSPTSLDGFPEDVAMVVAVELAHLQLLEDFFNVDPQAAEFTYGFSIGELTALVASDVFTLEQVLPVPLSLARDCASLATDVTMGILFTRGPVLDLQAVQNVCMKISSEGNGLIGPSSYLAPNAALILGQGQTVDRLNDMKAEVSEGRVILRRNKDKWPPLHTPLVWSANISNRSAVHVYHIKGGTTAPHPPILSCVTGRESYNEFNARDHLARWTDHPQLLWDVIYESLSRGVETVIHVGPEPNIFPATYARLATNVSQQLSSPYLQVLSRGVVTGLNRFAWLGNLLPAKSALLRAPYLEHIILEDWLLEQEI